MKARFVEAANYTPADRNKQDIWYLVVHDEEAPEDQGEALRIAEYFSHQPHSNEGSSAHRIVDDKEIVHAVHWKDIAWAAPGANTNGLHWEQSGYVTDHKRDWESEYGLKQMHLLAVDIANACKFFGIRPVRLKPSELKENARLGKGKYRGICGHDTVTKAFPNIGTHTDPGPHYPWNDLMNKIKAHYERLT